MHALYERKKDSIISNSKTFNKYVNGFVKKAFLIKFWHFL